MYLPTNIHPFSGEVTLYFSTEYPFEAYNVALSHINAFILGNFVWWQIEYVNLFLLPK
jgi:hypothetical protein